MNQYCKKFKPGGASSARAQTPDGQTSACAQCAYFSQKNCGWHGPASLSGTDATGGLT